MVEAGFCPLDSRPMIDVTQSIDGLNLDGLERIIRAALAGLDRDAIFRLKLLGEEAHLKASDVTQAKLRKWAPDAMNIRLVRQVR